VVTARGSSDISSPDLYVQIPAYRDLELVPTLRDLYARASRPGRLRVRVMWQRSADEVLPDDVRALPRLEIDEVSAATSEGCNWARLRLQESWAGERYTLLLDSHHRFVDGWDDLALEMVEQLRAAGTSRPMLTGYLPAYDPSDVVHRSTRPQRLYPYARDGGVLTRLKGGAILDAEALTEPVAADFASLHFLLVDGCFNEEVPFDPAVYFFGDEVLTSVRAFAAGYRLFHPHRLIGWHDYDRNSRVPHWADHDGYAVRHDRSLAVIRQWLAGEREISSAEVAAFESHVNLCLVT